MHRLAVQMDDDDLRKELGDWALKSESAQKIQAMIKVAETEHKIPILAKDLDADPFLLGVKNGVINLHTGEWLSPRREDYITKQAPIDFDPEATCPLWEGFLSQSTGGDTEFVAYLQRAAGYFLTGRARERCLFILYGPGANGKVRLSADTSGRDG